LKTLGLIGGTTWLSTIDYYRIINQLVNERLGGLHSANLLLRSVDFHELKKLVDTQSWPEIGKYLSELAIQLENAGADCIVLCANTMHMVADMVQQNIHIPLIHIAEATANEILKQRIQKVGLLGTRFTMEQPFFTDILSHKNIQTFIPNEEQRMFIHTSIFDEIGKNIFKEATKNAYLGIIENLRKQGAEGIIFGCTEIPMLIKAEECSIPVFDTTFIYATAAVEFAQQKPL
jgi:aspartate racemase